MSLPNEKTRSPIINELKEKEEIRAGIARLKVATTSARGRKLLELSARILETEAPLLELDEINASLGREYNYE